MFQKICFMIFGMILACSASNLVRYPVVSGQFYPASSADLKKDIATYLGAIKQEPPIPKSAKILGMIVPHAGYKYSGQTAAYVYKLIKDYPVDVIILIGPYHASPFPGVSIWPEGDWQTPLGKISIEESLAKSLRDESPDFLYDFNIHSSEHSLEVQIPFIQSVSKTAKIVPILISDVKYAKSLAQALYKHLRGRSACVIVSTDLSHYHPDPTARNIDQNTQNAIQKLSPPFFQEAYEKGEIELCGAAAVLTLLELNALSGQGEYQNLNYANSGNNIHDKSSVVGYNASLILTSNEIKGDKGNILINLAKDTLSAYLKNQTAPSFIIEDPVLTQKRAVFVTLRDKRGNLRGCMGRFEAEEPLYLAVQHMIIEAATQDIRFATVTLNEVKDLLIEISILDKPLIARSAQDIVYGTHGVIVSQGKRSGVFLPEVSKNFRTKDDFLSELCFQKADLPRNCWQNPLTQIQIFTTQTIHEKP
ncbi:MAG: AmmeMemoRadiSam system protein B [Alphaproteobacteria bacterium]|nr:AmmeMemoRadiSam system protein B [Alphaproteobacteria bacterium]